MLYNYFSNLIANSISKFRSSKFFGKGGENAVVFIPSLHGIGNQVVF